MILYSCLRLKVGNNNPKKRTKKKGMRYGREIPEETCEIEMLSRKDEHREQRLRIGLCVFARMKFIWMLVLWYGR